MKKYALLFLLILTACNTSELKKEFNCKNMSYSNLETLTDVRNLFSLQLPKHWKTNLYYDYSQSSIYSADTTKSLTQTTLLDVTLIHANLNFTPSFLSQLNKTEKELQLTNVKSKPITFLKKPSYIQQSKGKKGKYNYQIINIYSIINSDNFLHSKIELYGDSLVKKRFCKAIYLLEKISLK